jgi:hypothetical protein
MSVNGCCEPTGRVSGLKCSAERSRAPWPKNLVAAEGAKGDCEG